MDSDLPQNITLRIPYRENDLFGLTEITLPSIAPYVPLESQPLPKPAEFQQFLNELSHVAVPDSITDSINHLVRVLKTIYPLSKTVTDFLVVLNQHWAADLGIQWLDLPVSHMAQSSTFLIFVADMILRAGQVRHCYNAALRQYRHSHKIRNASQPLPELQDSDDPAEPQELPLWTSQPNQPRQPLRIQPDQNEIILLAGKTAFAKLSLDRLVDPECAVSEL